MKSSLSFILLLLLCSCSNKNYNLIRIIKEDYNNKSVEQSIVLRNKGFNPTKKIFKKIDNELTGDFIFIFSWVNHLPLSGANHYKAIVLDKISNQTFYINNTIEDVNKIYLSTDSANFFEEQIILNGFLNEKIDSLISLKPRYISSEIGTDYYIFDSSSKKAYVIEKFTIK